MTATKSKGKDSREAAFLIRKMSPTLRQAFKSACVDNAVGMEETLVGFIEKYVSEHKRRRGIRS
jgi:hypothetical protein